MSFQEYKGSPFAEWLLPIIPLDARMTEKSRIEENNLGKIPGLKYGTAWTGFPNWTNARITDDRAARILAGWDSWYYPAQPIIGLQSARYPGIDLDVNEKWQANFARDCAFEILGKTIVRGRSDGAPRQLLMYRLDQSGPPIVKFRRVYAGPETPEFAIEVLGKGQQYLIEGKHKAGGMYVWDVNPLEYGFENLPRISPDQLMVYISQLDKKFALLDVVPQRPQQLRGGDTGRGEDPKAINDEHPEKASDLGVLTEVLGYINVLDPQLAAYDDWERVCRAIKTAAAGSEEFYDQVYLPWQQENPDNDDDTVRAKWESHTDSSIGFGFLEGLAARNGYVPSGAGLFNALGPDDGTAATSGPSEAPTRYRVPVPKPLPEGFALNKLPRRPFVLGHRFMAGTVTLGVGAPGAGKSNLAILTALAIATGRPLTGEEVHRTGPVWIHNNEDSLDELDRRVGGTLKSLGIDFNEVRPNILRSSGLDEPLIVANKQQKDIVTRAPAVAAVIASIKEQGIVHMVIDPLISTHRGVSENSNEEIEQVMETIQHIAHETGCSIDLIHHSLKSHSHNTEVHAGDMNAARGASALNGAARMAYTLTQMNEKTAEKMKLSSAQAARLIRLDHSKGNYAPRDPHIRWFELEPFDIGNGDLFPAQGSPIDGDTIAVPKPWNPPAKGIKASKAVDHAGRLQQVRDVVAGAMSSDRCSAIELLPAIEKQFGVRKSKARTLLKEAIPEGDEETADVGPHNYSLKIERDDPSPPGRVFVVRRHLFEQKAEAA